MAGMLEAALAWAARGFRVFPLAAGTKDKPLVPFTEMATTDAGVITSWWRDPVMGIERDYNIGVETTGLNVVDIDVRNGKQGLQSFVDLVGGFDTLTVMTPSGGYHCYYEGPDAANKVGNGKNGWPVGIDIRSHHGYVVGPGSITQEGQYRVLIDGRPEATPPPVLRLLTPPNIRPVAVQSSEEDTPSAISMATAYLAGPATPAVEGQGGDSTTYQVSCRVRDFGLSEAVAFRLINAIWNPRCDPPWHPDELKVKVANAYAYATGEAGVVIPEKLFASVTTPPIEAVKPVDEGAIRFGNALDLASIPPRRWLLTKMLMRQAVTVVAAPGGTGKSSLSLTIAAHLALGLNFMDFTTVLRDGERGVYSMVYNAEDDVAEMSRRLHAICQHYHFPFDRVRAHIALIDRKSLRLRITEGRPPKVNVSHVQALMRAASTVRVGAMFFDPLVAIHESDELDNSEMAFVMDTLQMIAEMSDTAACAIHHTNKPIGASSKGRAGDANSIRGATAVVTPARAAYTLYSADEADCEEYGIPPDDRDLYSRLDSAKANLSRRGTVPRWLKARTIKVGKDDVGVFAPVDLVQEAKEASILLARVIVGEMRQRNTAWMKLGEIVEWVRKTDAMYGKIPEKTVRARLQNWYAHGVHTGSETLIVKDAPTGTGVGLGIE